MARCVPVPVLLTPRASDGGECVSRHLCLQERKRSVDELTVIDEWAAEMFDFSIERIGTRDVPLWCALAQEAHGHLLELACGTGRVMFELARRGHRVCGLDNSPHMLAIARRKLALEDPEVQTRCEFVEADMKEFHLGNSYSLIYSPFRSFESIIEPSEQRRSLTCCLEHLAPGGRLVLALAHSQTPLMSPPRGDRTYEGPRHSSIREISEITVDTFEQTALWHTQYASTTNGRTEVHYEVGKSHYFFRTELWWMLEACGLTVETFYGDFQRGPLTRESRELIVVARPKIR